MATSVAPPPSGSLKRVFSKVSFPRRRNTGSSAVTDYSTYSDSSTAASSQPSSDHPFTLDPGADWRSNPPVPCQARRTSLLGALLNSDLGTPNVDDQKAAAAAAVKAVSNGRQSAARDMPLPPGVRIPPVRPNSLNNDTHVTTLWDLCGEDAFAGLAVDGSSENGWECCNCASPCSIAESLCWNCGAHLRCDQCEVLKKAPEPEPEPQSNTC